MFQDTFHYNYRLRKAIWAMFVAVTDGIVMYVGCNRIWTTSYHLLANGMIFTHIWNPLSSHTPMQQAG